MEVIENFFAPDVFSVLAQEVISGNVGWYALPGRAGTGDTEDTTLEDYGFASVYDIRASFIATYVEAAVVTELNKQLGVRIKNLIRIRLGLQTYVGGSGVSSPHTDHDSPHKTLLVYLNDADGDTIFYDMVYEPDSGEHPIEYARKRKEWLHVKDTVTPRANKAVVFDGMRYHSSSQPTKTQMRYVLNVNFVEM